MSDELNLKEAITQSINNLKIKETIHELRIKETVKEKTEFLKEYINTNICNGKRFIKENPLLSLAISAILVILSVPVIPILAIFSILSIIIVSVILIFTVVIITSIGTSILGLIYKTLMLFVPITEITVKLFTYFSFFYLFSRTYKKSKKILNENNDVPKYKAIIDSFAETLVDYISLVCAISKNIKKFILAVIRNSIEKKKLNKSSSSSSSCVCSSDEKRIEDEKPTTSTTTVEQEQTSEQKIPEEEIPEHEPKNEITKKME